MEVLGRSSNGITGLIWSAGIIGGVLKLSRPLVNDLKVPMNVEVSPLH